MFGYGLRNAFGLLLLVSCLAVGNVKNANAQARSIFAFQAAQVASVNIDIREIGPDAAEIRNIIRHFVLNRNFENGRRFTGFSRCPCLRDLGVALTGVTFEGGYHPGPAGIYRIRIGWEMRAVNNPNRPALAFGLRAGDRFAAGTVEIDVFYDVITLNSNGGTLADAQGNLRQFDQNNLNRNAFGNITGRRL